MKRKLLILVPVLLLAGAGYKLVLAKPKPEPEHKIEGMVYVLPRGFLLNLAGGRYAKLDVGLVVEHEALAAEGGGEEAAAKPPEGYGPLPQEAVVRTLITEELIGLPASRLTDGDSRERLKKKLVRAIKRGSDVPVEDVLFTDLSVQ